MIGLNNIFIRTICWLVGILLVWFAVTGVTAGLNQTTEEQYVPNDELYSYYR